MRDSRIGCLPVGDKDRLVGMITDRDIACRAVANGSDPAKTKARDVMTKGITYCFDDETLEEALHMMADKGIHHLPVLKRSKRTIGILALGDVALKGAPALRTFPNWCREMHHCMREILYPTNGLAGSFAAASLAPPRCVPVSAPGASSANYAGDRAGQP
jgi:predicted transcriptional regulator